MSACEIQVVDDGGTAVNALRNLLRIFSYLFNGLFAAASLAWAVIILGSGPQTINASLLPVAGRAQAFWLIGVGIAGFLILLAAVRGKGYLLYAAWTVFAFALVVRFFFFTEYSYVPDSGDYLPAVYAVFAGVLAAIGAGVKPAENAR
jgi:hypothetical protein